MSKGTFFLVVDYIVVGTNTQVKHRKRLLKNLFVMRFGSIVQILVYNKRLLRSVAHLPVFLRFLLVTAHLLCSWYLLAGQFVYSMVFIIRCVSPSAVFIVLTMVNLGTSKSLPTETVILLPIKPIFAFCSRKSMHIYFTHLRLNNLPHSLPPNPTLSRLEEFNFNFRYVWQCDLDIPKKMQTVETCVCTVSQLPFWRSPY